MIRDFFNFRFDILSADYKKSDAQDRAKWTKILLKSKPHIRNKKKYLPKFKNKTIVTTYRLLHSMSISSKIQFLRWRTIAKCCLRVELT